MYKIFVGLDLGSKCGISVLSGDRMITHEISFGSTKKEPMKYVNFKNHVYHLLQEILLKFEPDEVIVFYEYVARHLGTKAAHAYGAYRMILLMCCYELQIKSDHLSVQAIKKAATSKGAAKKDKMIESAKNRFNPQWEITDNEADSMWIAYLGREISNENLETVENSKTIQAVKGNGSLFNNFNFE